MWERRSDSAAVPSGSFCRFARSASSCRAGTSSITLLGKGSRSTHMTSPICHTLIPCPLVEKHCSYKYWMYWERGRRSAGLDINFQMKLHRKQNSLPRSLTAVTHADVTRDECLPYQILKFLVTETSPSNFYGRSTALTKKSLIITSLKWEKLALNIRTSK